MKDGERPDVQPARILDPRQVQALLTSVKGTPYDAQVQLELATSSRLGELLGLKWFDLDWEIRYLTVQRQLLPGFEIELPSPTHATDSYQARTRMGV